VGGSQRPPGPGGPDGGLHPRGEDRWCRGEPHVRGRRARDRHDARERRGGRRRNRQPAHRGGRTPAPQGQELAQADGGPRRGLLFQVAIRGAEPRARAGGRAALREPPQRCRGVAPSARPEDHPRAAPADLLFPHRSSGPEAARRYSARASGATRTVGVSGRTTPSSPTWPGRTTKSSSSASSSPHSITAPTVWS